MLWIGVIFLVLRIRRSNDRWSYNWSEKIADTKQVWGQNLQMFLSKIKIFLDDYSRLSPVSVHSRSRTIGPIQCEFGEQCEGDCADARLAAAVSFYRWIPQNGHSKNIFKLKLLQHRRCRACWCAVARRLHAHIYTICRACANDVQCVRWQQHGEEMAECEWAFINYPEYLFAALLRDCNYQKVDWSSRYAVLQTTLRSITNRRMPSHRSCTQCPARDSNFPCTCHSSSGRR